MKRIFAGLGMFSGWLLVFIMILMCAEVFCRYVLNSPILGTVEISSYLLVFLSSVGHLTPRRWTAYQNRLVDAAVV